MERDYAALRRALKKPEVKGKPSVDELKKLAESTPGSFVVQMELAQVLHEAGDRAGAIQALERASALVPTASRDSNPNALIARIAMEQKDSARAIRALEAVLKVDNSAVEAARQLVGLLAPLNDAARSEDAYRRFVAIDPFDTQAQTGLGQLALRRKDAQTAQRAFRSALAANPPDRAAAYVDLAEAYLLTGQVADARRQILAALEIAPSFERAQDLLLKIVESPGGERQ
jgi:tetratricopeptide (TPR) repeat protein